VPNSASVSHDAEKFCFVCNKLREKSIFVNFRKNIRLFIFTIIQDTSKNTLKALFNHSDEVFHVFVKTRHSSFFFGGGGEEGVAEVE
jgi:hypothetical protein